MKHVDLFSGIGGFSLAVDWAFEEVEHIFCEIDPFCQKILKKHWPKAQIHDDIKQFKADNLGRVDLLTGGFPCQPFSVAGEQRAQDDDRHLWPEMFRIIKECRPSWIIGENVAGIIELALEQVCLDLESEGYEVWPIILPACAVNSPHRRDRLWIIANANSKRRWGRKKTRNEKNKPKDKEGSEEVKLKGCADREVWSDWQEFSSSPYVSRTSDGIPNRTHRIKALGNAIVPQIVYEIIKLIRETQTLQAQKLDKRT